MIKLFGKSVSISNGKNILLPSKKNPRVKRWQSLNFFDDGSDQLNLFESEQQKKPAIQPQKAENNKNGGSEASKNISSLEKKAAGKAVAKEPWEMTRDEFVSSEIDKLSSYAAPEIRKQRIKEYESKHKNQIIPIAIKEGKTVPEEVLKDYETSSPVKETVKVEEPEKQESEVADRIQLRKQQPGESFNDWLDRLSGYTGTPEKIKADRLRSKAKKLTEEAHNSLSGVVPGQPIVSISDRNRRERAMEKMKKATDLMNQADLIEEKKPEPVSPSENSIPEPTGTSSGTKGIEKPVVAPVSKEPWEMTNKEVLESIRTKPTLSGNNNSLIGLGKNILTSGMTIEGIPAKEIPGWEDVLLNHKKAVQQALSEGKSVPEEVLKDYPELTKNAKTESVNAEDFAREKHKDHKYNGKPYFDAHVKKVAVLAEELAKKHGRSQSEISTIKQAAYLHDVLEDTDVTPEEIEKKFGAEVRKVTEILSDRIKSTGVKKNREEYFKGIGSSQLAKEIKLADRLTNLDNMMDLEDEEQKRKLHKKYQDDMKYFIENDIYPDQVQEKIDNAKFEDEEYTAPIPLPGIAGYSAKSSLEGENGSTCLVERQYREFKQLNFTGKVKIKDSGDVAFLLKQLSEEAVEHGFAVYAKKDGTFIAQHLSSGSINASIISTSSMMDMVHRFKPDKLYFVHNHPSGNLTASNEDERMAAMIERVTGVETVGVIIDSRNNNYSEIFASTPNNIPKVDGAVNVPIYSFSKAYYHGDVLDKKINSAGDAAGFISGHRFSEGKTAMALMLNSSNQVVGRYTLNKWSGFSGATPEQVDESAEELKYLISATGAKSFIVGTNQHREHIEQATYASKIYQKIKNTDMNMFDMVSIDPENGNYKSAAETGMLKSVVLKAFGQQMNLFGGSKMQEPSREGQTREGKGGTLRLSKNPSGKGAHWRLENKKPGQNNERGQQQQQMPAKQPIQRGTLSASRAYEKLAGMSGNNIMIHDKSSGMKEVYKLNTIVENSDGSFNLITTTPEGGFAPIRFFSNQAIQQTQDGLQFQFADKNVIVTNEKNEKQPESPEQVDYAISRMPEWEKTAENLIKRAEGQKERFLSDIDSVSQENGLEAISYKYRNHAVKSKESIIEKLHRLETKGVFNGKLTDTLRGTIIIKNPSQYEGIMSSFAAKGYKVWENDVTNLYEDKSPGYKHIAVKLTKGDSDDVVKEVLMLTPKMYEAKYGFGHDLYDVMKKVEIAYGGIPEKHAARENLKRFEESIKRISNEFYNQAYLADMESARVLSEPPSASTRTISRNRSSVKLSPPKRLIRSIKESLKINLEQASASLRSSSGARFSSSASSAIKANNFSSIINPTKNLIEKYKSNISNLHKSSKVILFGKKLDV